MLNRREWKNKVLQLALKSEDPLTVPRVAEELGITYPATQAILYDLTIEGFFRLVSSNLPYTCRYFVPNKEKILQAVDLIVKER